MKKANISIQMMIALFLLLVAIGALILFYKSTTGGVTVPSVGDFIPKK